MTCYFPDGTPSPVDSPCDPSAEQSACCGPTAYCLTNGLCMGLRGGLSRGSCTDLSWNSPRCAQNCRRANPGGGMPLFSCADRPEGTNFTCGGGDCEEDGFIIEQFGFVMKDYQLNDTIRNSDVAVAEVCEGAAAAETSAAAVGPESSTGVAAAAASGSCPEGPGSTCAPGFSSSAMAGVGLGVGLPLLIAVLTLLWLLRRERKNRQEHFVGSPRVPLPSQRIPTTAYASKLNMPEKSQGQFGGRDPYRMQPDRMAPEMEVGETYRHELDSGSSRR